MHHNFLLGACSAHYCLGRVVNVIVDILQAVKITPVPKWGDDLFPICFPIGTIIKSDDSITYKYSYNLTLLKDTLAPLGVPWHASKWNDFCSKPVYLGLV